MAWKFYKPDPDEVKIATTIAGLGVATHGRTAALRIGADPYDLISLTYDSTIAKWVSEAVLIPVNAIGATMAANAYEGLSGGTQTPCHISNFKRKYDAGLRPQVQITFCAYAAAGTPNAYLGLGLNEYTSGDTAIVELGTQEGAVFDGGAVALSTSAKWFATDWLPANMNAPAEAHVEVSPQGKVSASTMTVLRMAINWRWVSA